MQIKPLKIWSTCRIKPHFLMGAFSDPGLAMDVRWKLICRSSLRVFFPFCFLLSLWDRSTMTEVKSLNVAMSVSSMEYVPEGQILVITYGKTIAFHSAETWVHNSNFHRLSHGLLVGKNWLYKARITKLSKPASLWCLMKASYTLKHIPEKSSVCVSFCFAYS